MQFHIQLSLNSGYTAQELRELIKAERFIAKKLTNCHLFSMSATQGITYLITDEKQFESTYLALIKKINLLVIDVKVFWLHDPNEPMMQFIGTKIQLRSSRYNFDSLNAFIKPSKRAYLDAAILLMNYDLKNNVHHDGGIFQMLKRCNLANKEQ
jgi:hypothetical protein